MICRSSFPRRVLAALAAAALVACTATPDDVPTPPTQASAPSGGGAGASSEGAEPTEGAGPCVVSKSMSLDGGLPRPSPEAAVAEVAQKPAKTGFDAVVRPGTVTFYARDGSATYFAHPLDNGWVVDGIDEPSCPPPLLDRAAGADPDDLDCVNVRAYIYDRTYTAPSELEALHDELATVGAPRDSLPRGAYVKVGRKDGRTIYGHFGNGALQATVRVWSSRDGFGVESASWCARN